MQILWKVIDGYAGIERPRFIDIEDSEIQNCETVKEAVELIEDTIRCDFEQQILWQFDPEEHRPKIAKLVEFELDE